MLQTTLAYDFVAPRKIVFGWGRRAEAGRLARTLGRRAFVVIGSRALIDQGAVGQICNALAAEGVEPIQVEIITHEPEVDDVDRLSQRLRENRVAADDLMLAIGGGSAIDLAKAAAAMATNQESPTVKDYLENVGRDLKIRQPPLPVMALPTTAGTGTEATRNAVISSYDPPFKKSLRDERILPQIALVDPELSVSVPAETTAASGMDAITQLIESYISRKAQPIPRALARQGLELAVPVLGEAVRNGGSRPARERMAHAAMLSGMCLANSGLGMAHGVAAALGVHCRAAHGAACALMLPVALRVNRQVCQHDLAELSCLLYGPEPSPEAAVARLIDQIDALCDAVGVPRRLSQLGVTRLQIPAIVQSSRGSSMSGNPRDLSDEELTQLLEQIL